MGLKNLKIIDSSYYRHIECDELIATQHPSYFKGFILDQAKYVPDWIIKWLRGCFLEKSKKIEIKDNIFIDRSLSNFKHSQIVNLEETQNLLKEKNFDIVKLENLSFDEQIFVFSNAKIVVGAHGAGLTNLCFSKEKTKVIEIRSNPIPDSTGKINITASEDTWIEIQNAHKNIMFSRIITAGETITLSLIHI